jgi:hypothetical protein
MVSRPVCLGFKPHVGPKTRFLLLSDTCGFVYMVRPLWREDGSVVRNCCCSSPAQSFSGPSPAELTTIFYCLRFEIPPTWRVMPGPYLFISSRNRVAQLHPSSGFPFRHLLRLAGLRRRYSNKSQSYFTTSSLPPSCSSWRQAPWDSRSEIFFFNWILAVLVLM